MSDHTGPSLSDREYDAEELEFLKAVDKYKREHGRQFLSATEWLAIAVSLGYRRVAEPGPPPGAKS